MYVSLSHTITSSCIEQVARRNAFAVEFLFSIAALGRPPLPRLEDASHVFDVLQRSYYQLSSSFLFLRLIPLAPSSPLRCALPSHTPAETAPEYNLPPALQWNCDSELFSQVSTPPADIALSMSARD